MNKLIGCLVFFVGIALTGSAVAQVSRYVPVNPVRLMDTRSGGTTVDGQFAGGGPIASYSSVNLTVVGRAGIPGTGVTAVALNVTVTNPTGVGYLTVWPAGVARPNAANMNFTPGLSISNQVVAKVGTGGQVSIYMFAGTGSGNVVVDVAGYFPATSDLTPLTPARLLDTRSGFSTIDGQYNGVGAIPAAGQLDLLVLGRGGVPASGVSAVVLNVTADAPTSTSFITAWSSGTSKPNTASLNVVAGQTVANLVIMAPGAGGKISFYNNQGSTQLVVDVAGYFSSSATFSSLTPARLLETRPGFTTIDGQFAGQGPLGSNATLSFTVLGRGGVPATGVGAVALNVVSVAPSTNGYLVAWGTGTTPGNAPPQTMDVNFTAPGDIPSLVIAQVGPNGQVSINNHSAGTTHLVADVAGWFPASIAGPPSPPTSVTAATGNASNSAVVNWIVASGGAAPTYLKIQRATSLSGPWTAINSNYTPATSGQLVDLVFANATYYYGVAACNAAGCSSFTVSSPGATIASIPAAPTSDAPALASTPATDPVSDSVGATAAQFRVDEGGNATYSIPIQVPPGTAGVTPKLALSYNSRLPNGVMGPGWTIEGASQIGRCRQTRESGDFGQADGNPSPVNFTATDRFCLDGVRLLLLAGNSGSYGADGTTYSPETDPTTKVTAHVSGSYMGPDSFTVRRKDGTTSTYGYMTSSPNALISASLNSQNVAVGWNLARVQDSKGNYIDYLYNSRPSGSTLAFAAGAVETTLAQVNYTGHATAPVSSPYASISFAYTTLSTTLIRLGYQSGVAFVQTQQLTSVTVTDASNTGNSTLRYYALTYQASSSGSQFQQVQKIQECRDSSKAVCFAPTTFTWSAAQNTLQSGTKYQSQTGPNFTNLAGYKIADVDGDGRQDFVWAVNNGVCGSGKSAIYVGFLDRSASGEMTLTTASQTPACAAIDLTNSDQSWALLDYDGDGRADLLLGGAATSTWKLLQSQGRPAAGGAVFSGDLLAAQGIVITTPGCFFDQFQQINVCNNATGILADLNGDGLPDFIVAEGSNYGWDVRLLQRQSDGSLRFSTPYWLTYTVNDAIFQSFDPSRSPTAEITVLNSNTSSHKSAIAADVNGDGRTDLMAQVSIYQDPPCGKNCLTPTPPTRRQYWAQFTIASVTPPNGPNPGQVQLTEAWYDANLKIPVDNNLVYVVDLNGDGLADVLYQDLTTSTTYWALINNGNASTQTSMYNAPIAVTGISNGQYLQLVDINGDGKTDLVYPVTSLTDSTAYSSFNYVSVAANSSGWYFTAPTTVPGGGLIGHNDWIHLIGDFDGDGAPDYFGLSTTASSNNLYASRAANGSRYQPRDVITDFTNGLGATTHVAYQSLTNIGVYQRGGTNGYPAVTGSIDYGWGSPVFDVLAPMYVVSQASSSAPTQADANAMSAVYYRYAGALMQSGGRGFLGFFETWSFDANDSASVGNRYVATLNRYAQRFPVTGMPIATLKESISGAMTRGSAQLDACAANPETLNYNCFSGITGSGSAPTFQIAWPGLSATLLSYSYQAPICAGPGCLTTVSSTVCTLGGNNSMQLVSRPTDYTANVFNGTANPGPVFGYVSYAQDTLFDLTTGSPAGQVATSEVENWFCYDGNGSTAGYGNLMGSRTKNSDASGTTAAEKIVANSYADNLANWQLGRLAQSTVTFARPGRTTRSRSTSYTYDSTSGLLTSERIQPGGSADQDLRTLYDLDAYGNRIAAYQCSANLSDAQCRAHSGVNHRQAGTTVLRYAKTTYDSLGRYSTSSSLPFATVGGGWNEQAAMNVGQRDEFGNAVQQKSINDSSGTTINGLATTQWSKFGTLGRPYFAADNTGKSSTTTFRMCNGANSVSCSTDTRLKFRSQTVTSGAPTSWTYFDLLGRPVLQVTRSFDGNSATNQFSGVCTYTDAHNRPTYQSEPFFLPVTAAGDGSPNLASSASPCNSAAYATTSTYDVLGRVTKLTQPDGNAINKTYTPLTTTTSSPRNAAWVWTQVTNALGEVVSTQDPQVTGDTTVGLTVTQTYDAMGDVLTITRNAGSGSIVNSYVYDDLGRKTSQSDPDSGNASFTYNAAGDVISQTDAQGQIITLSYDAQGRKWQRATSYAADGNNLTDTWSYDTAANGYGQLANETRSGTGSGVTAFTRSFAYDAYGRSSTRTTTIGIKSYPETTVYDSLGRVKAQVDVSGHYASPSYSANGYTQSLSDTRVGTLYQLLTTTERGQVASDRRGSASALQSQLTYYANTGRLNTVCSGSGTSCNLQDLQYHFDAAGNLDARNRAMHGAKTSESFAYDALNRLKSAGLVTINGINQTTIPTLGLTYDKLGNICTKSPLSGGTINYQYAGMSGCALHGSLGSPHAAIFVGGVAYGYDANGNQTTNGASRAISYNALNQVTSSIENSVTVAFQYGPDGDRFQRTDSDTGTMTYYVGKTEILITGINTAIRRYLGGVAIDYVKSVGTNETRYTFGDHLGSMDVIASASGALIESESFDAHGNRRDPTNWQGSAPPVTSTNNGFTGQEHVDSQSFIHFNGRIYDASIGRMLQVDPVQNPGSQGLNRYAYVANNPLTLTDPTGYSFWSWVRTIAAVAISVWTGGLALAATSFWSGMAIAAAGGFAAGVIATGTLQGGLYGAFSAAAFYGVGTWIRAAGLANAKAGSLAWGEAIGARAVTGGVVSSLEGGKFGNGFISAGVTAAASPVINNVGNRVGRAVVASIIGGTASELSGGKFGNAAITSAFAQMFADAAQGEKGKWLYPKGGSTNMNDYNTVRTNGILGGPETEFQQMANDTNNPVYYNPSHGPIADLLESFGQKFFGWAGDSLAQGFAEGLAGVDHPMTIIAHSQGVLTVVNAVEYYGLNAEGSTFDMRSSAYSYGTASSVISGAGGNLLFSTPYGDIANIYSPSYNPIKWVSGFGDIFCGACTHVGNGLNRGQ